MNLEIDPNTKVVCSKHRQQELFTAVYPNSNKIVVQTCPSCKAEMQEQAKVFKKFWDENEGKSHSDRNYQVVLTGREIDQLRIWHEFHRDDDSEQMYLTDEEFNALDEHLANGVSEGPY